MEYSESALQKVREDRLLIEEVDIWLYEEIQPYLGQRVLEIGCGLGNFIRHLTDRELYIGTETSADAVSYVKARYGHLPNVSAAVADATDSQFADFAQFKLDTIFSLNVFEHIEDHVTALRNAESVLESGGRVILVVPAHNWLYGSIDAAIGHYRRYDKRMMAELFAEANLTPVTQKYLNFMGALGWFVNGRIRKQETPPSGQLRLFNKIVPLLKKFERLIPVPFGISIMAVGQKQ